MDARPRLLDCAVQRYDWGDPTAIPALLGAPADGGPWAELWMGAHPRAPATLVEEGGAEFAPLDEAVAAQPDDVLSPRVHQAFGPRLPFLGKVLAARRSLSIQCHPDAEQAKAGFEREEASGVALDDPVRSYKDASHKPELMVALTPFAALCGLLPAGEVQAAFAKAGLIDAAPALRHLDDRGDAGLRPFFLELLRDRAGAGPLLERALAWAEGRPDDDRVATLVARLAAEHPGDPLALAPLIFSIVDLAPGEGLFLGPGLLHAYLDGVGVEVMAASDNVLRAGLTTKHIDLDELARVATFEPGHPGKVERRVEGPMTTWQTPAPEFALSRLDLRGEEPVAVRPEGGAVDVVLVTEGRARLEAAGEPLGAGLLEVGKGRVALVPAGAGPYRAVGPGVLWRITVP